ncbi:cyclase [Methanomicrobium sp. W14]|uniref:AglZ/HisF2 family acetamidino modification protein n=1 Tax=Methanomicrobium sp. W14 TaxID=2817839 RepID=UPI001AE39C9C|nr:AglZ/HisF2 family acetamidino modification protein [Methanomicrobium sp. W14]MBP2133110.1 cyclase [Methanomicrobium sp. W14]
MFRPRIIPALLLKDKGLVKTVQFRDPKYIGDPINAVHIYNDKKADELIFLNIVASRREGLFKRIKKHELPFDLTSKISRECLMPLSYGGGITSVHEIEMLFKSGVEKVIINTEAFNNPGLIREASEIFGSQSIIVSIDAKKRSSGQYEVIINDGETPAGLDPVTHAKEMESQGAGEIMINSIDLDGTMTGYDIELIRQVSDAVNIPVIACGGAGKISDFRQAYYEGHASALAAGSLFVFHGRKRAVLISYPTKKELEDLFSPEEML